MVPRRASSLTFTDEMTLTVLLSHYTSSVECSKRYVESLQRTVRKAECSGIKKVCQLTPDNVNQFLAGLPLGPTTRHNIRRELLTLWRHAYEECLTDTPPGRIRRIRAEYAPVRAWTPEQLERMLSVAAQDQTRISRRTTQRWCDVIPVWIRLNYDTGVRFEDIHSLSEEDFANGCISLTEHKTRKPLVRQLHPDTAAAVASLLRHSPDGTLFRWMLPRRRAFLMWRKFLDKYGFGGSTKWFRRTAATQIHRMRRGAATEFLQHSSPHLALRHYIDMSQMGDHLSPPALSHPT